MGFKRVLCIMQSDKTQKADTILLVVPISIILLLSGPSLPLIKITPFFPDFSYGFNSSVPSTLVDAAADLHSGLAALYPVHLYFILPVNLLCFLGHSSYCFAGSKF